MISQIFILAILITLLWFTSDILQWVLEKINNLIPKPVAMNQVNQSNLTEAAMIFFLLPIPP